MVRLTPGRRITVRIGSVPIGTALAAGLHKNGDLSLNSHFDVWIGWKKWVHC